MIPVARLPDLLALLALLALLSLLKMARPLVFRGSGYCLSALLLFGLSSAYADDRLAGETALGSGWPVVPGYPAGYSQGYQKGANPPGDAVYGQGQYRGQYADPPIPPAPPVPRGSAPWHRLVEPPHPLVHRWSSAQGSAYRSPPSSSVPRAPYRPGPQSSAYGRSPRGSGRYDPSLRTPAGHSAGFPQRGAFEPARPNQARSSHALANAPIIDYKDYTSIPEKPPSGMPKPGVDFIDAPGK